MRLILEDPVMPRLAALRVTVALLSQACVSFLPVLHGEKLRRGGEVLMRDVMGKKERRDAV